MIYLVVLAWAGAVTLAALLAVAAWRVRDEQPPVRRLALAIGLAAAATALAVGMGGVPRLFGGGAGPAVEYVTVQQRIAVLTRELEALRARETRLRRDLPRGTIDGAGRPIGQAITVERAPPLATGGGLAGGLIGLLLLYAALAALLVWPWLRQSGLLGGADQRAQMALLDQLAEEVWRQDYPAARAKAAEIKELPLRRAAVMDLYYLRSYAAVQIAAHDTGPDRATLLDEAVRDLNEIVAIAPKRGEAHYLLGLAEALRDKDRAAVAAFAAARTLLDDGATAIDHNESVCQLRLAEDALAKGDNAGAEAGFDRVTALGKFGESILQVRLKIALFDVRAAMGRQAIGDARGTLTRILGFPGLTDEQRATMDVLGAELAAREALLAGDAAGAIGVVDGFVARFLPRDLPPLDPDAVDESFSPLLDADLPFPREIFRNVLFVGAIARALRAGAGAGQLRDAEFDGLASPLLRALQIQPRHRDLLAAIGGLYYLARPDMRRQARGWMDAAATMGVDSRIVARLLAQDRALEAERRGVLDLFRDSSARFLRDPSLSAELRAALLERLGRFQEFEPLLLDLQARPDYGPVEPTVAVLRDRARYLAELVERGGQAGDPARQQRLAAIRAQYLQSLGTLEESAQSLDRLGLSVMTELSDALALH